MKRVLPLFFTLLGMICMFGILGGCSAESTSERAALLGSDWKMTMAYHVLENKILVSDDSAPDVRIQFAKDGSFVLTNQDEEPHTVWKGTYAQVLQEPDSILLELKFSDGGKGQAVCGLVTYADSSTAHTVLVTAEPYSISFEAVRSA